MTDTRPAKESLLGLPVPPPPLNGGGASEPLVTAEEGYARRAAWEKEFRERVVIHSELLLRFARAELESDADADDALQEVMRKVSKVDVVATCGGEDGRIKAYLLASMANYIRSEFRHRGREREKESKLTAFQRSRTNDEVPPSKDAESREILETIYRAVRELPWLHRAAYRLVRIEHVELPVAAQSLGISVKTLRVYVHEATRHLRERLRAAGYAPNAGGRRKEDTP